MRRSQQQDCVISKGQWKGQGFDFLEVIRPIGIWPFSPFQKATLLLSECWHLWKALWFSQNMQETVILTFFFFFPAFQFSFFLFFLFSFFSFFFFIILTFIFHLKTLKTWYICFFFFFYYEQHVFFKNIESEIVFNAANIYVLHTGYLSM